MDQYSNKEEKNKKKINKPNMIIRYYIIKNNFHLISFFSKTKKSLISRKK